MTGKCPDSITPCTTPCCFCSQCLIFAQHLQQPRQVTRHMPLCDRMNTILVDKSRNFNHQIIGEVGNGTATWYVHRPHFLTVVEYRIHNIDRELKLMDTAARSDRKSVV